MGSMARQSRADRFIKEFEEDLVERSAYKVGQTLKIVSVHLAQDDNEEVRLFLTLQDEKGETFPVHDDAWGLFDPELYTDDDYNERVADDLGVSVEEVRKRMEKAELD